jgi:hypothetical protein
MVQSSPTIGGLADHHAKTMIDEYAPADHRAGMDFDPGQTMRADVEMKRPSHFSRCHQHQCASDA